MRPGTAIALGALLVVILGAAFLQLVVFAALTHVCQMADGPE